jgi:hypothetical protein
VYKNLAKAITFGAGLYYLLEFLLPAKIGGVANPFTECYGTVTIFLMVLGAMAFFLGPINLVRGEYKQFISFKKGWVESLVFLVALVMGILVTVFRSDKPSTGFVRVMSVGYDALFYGVQLSFYVTSMGLISFYLVSAAHRAFLLNTVESGLMMAAATIVMLGLTPAGDYINLALLSILPQKAQWLQVGNVAQWILSTPNTAVQKAVIFGACGGAFAAGIRNWLSLERSMEQQ